MESQRAFLSIKSYDKGAWASHTGIWNVRPSGSPVNDSNDSNDSTLKLVVKIDERLGQVPGGRALRLPDGDSP